MTLSLPRLQSLLLDLLSPIRPVSRETVEGLDPDDWDTLLGMARKHRLEPLLHWRLTRERRELPVPEQIGEELALSFKRATLRSLSLQSDLRSVDRILDQVGIPHVALKGAFLAFHAYPQPALRPMRDLDILVPRDQLPQAYEALIQGGLTRMEQYQGTQRDDDKHLPPLHAPSGQVHLELHSRFYLPEIVPDRLDPSNSPQFWQRCVERKVAGEAIPFESPTDLLLHLIVHAVFDHQFDNGPLLLSDLSYLLGAEAINWQLFWSLAQAGGHTRGCLLALKLTQRYWGEKGIVWPEGGEDETSSLAVQLQRAAFLMFRDIHVRDSIVLAKEIGAHPTMSAKLSVMLGRVFAPRGTIAANHGVPSESFRLFFRYPVHWWRLVTRRIPALYGLCAKGALQDELRQLAELDQWLRHPE